MNNYIYLIGNENDLKDTIIIKKEFNYNLLSLNNLPLSYYPLYKSIENNKLKNIYKANVYYNSSIISVSNGIKPIKVEGKTNNYYLEIDTDGTVIEIGKDLICKLLIVGSSSSTYNGQVTYLNSYPLKKGTYTINISPIISPPSSSTPLSTSINIGSTIYDKLYAMRGIDVAQEHSMNFYKYKTIDNYLKSDERTSRISESQYTVKNIGNYTNKIFNTTPTILYLNDRYNISDLTISSLYIHYKFDDISNIGKDSSINAKDLTKPDNRNAFTLSLDKFLQFTTNGCLSRTFSNSEFQNNYSISFWIKINQNEGNINEKDLMGLSFGDPLNITLLRWRICFKDNNLYLFENTYPTSVRTNNFYILITNIVYNEFYYITIVFDNVACYIYKNSVLIRQLAYYFANANIAYTFYIGKYFNDSFTLTDSLLNDVKFYNTALTQTQISSIYNSLKNYIQFYNADIEYFLWYKFDVSSIANIGKDSSGNEMDLIATAYTRETIETYNGYKCYNLKNGYLSKVFRNRIFCPNNFLISFYIKIGEFDYNSSNRLIILSTTSTTSTTDDYIWIIYYHNKNIYFAIDNQFYNISIDRYNEWYMINISINLVANNYVIRINNVLHNSSLSTYLALNMNTDYNFYISNTGTYRTYTYGKCMNSIICDLKFIINYRYNSEIIYNIDIRNNVGRVIIEYMKSDNIIEDKNDIIDIKNTDELILNHRTEFNKILKRFNNEDKPYNTFNIYPIVILIIIGWIFIILIILKFISYYYSYIYTYFIIYTIIILLFITSLWFIFVNNNI